MNLAFCLIFMLVALFSIGVDEIETVAAVAALRKAVTKAVCGKPKLSTETTDAKKKKGAETPKENGEPEKEEKIDEKKVSETLEKMRESIKKPCWDEDLKKSYYRGHEMDKSKYQALSITEKQEMVDVSNEIKFEIPNDIPEESRSTFDICCEKHRIGKGDRYNLYWFLSLLTPHVEDAAKKVLLCMIEKWNLVLEKKDTLPKCYPTSNKPLIGSTMDLLVSKADEYIETAENSQVNKVVLAEGLSRFVKYCSLNAFIDGPRKEDDDRVDSEAHGRAFHYVNCFYINLNSELGAFVKKAIYQWRNEFGISTPTFNFD